MQTPCERRLIFDDALDGIGRTPLVRLDRMAKAHGLKCNLLAKAEFYSSGGSVKDRIAKRMVEEAEKQGRLIPGKSVVIEPTSGNTGIGLALVCAIKGYSCIIVLPEKMSLEKELTLRALGAEIVRTPTAAPSQSEDSNLGVALRLEKSIPGGVILDQYKNPNNPMAHEFGTGPEIIHAITATKSTEAQPSSGKVDVLVAGAGTGGTLSGLSKVIKTTHNPACRVVGVDPVGSVLAGPSKDKIGGYMVEGIGYDFVPEVMNYQYVDSWVKTEDEETFRTACEIIRQEGLLVGGSSGALVCAALRFLKSQEGFEKYGNVAGQNVVVMLPDNIRNYMSKDWFLEGTQPKVASKLSGLICQAIEQTKPAESPNGQPYLSNGGVKVTVEQPKINGVNGVRANGVPS
ncbi:cystathionine beta-synthase [Tulasnella sp. JGI-2019a]|nr:cystathionine beta-synthase [Tulasnella sp. JGI-2019a]KAG9008110.1 cystathionine beta-synthase [Tulasnella sp. JGI-2019a]KAG9033538.1 cystathionine beta-synthase [Tulasnella sp. JGI-2019a]